MLNNYTIPPKTYFEIASLGYLLVLYLISFNDPNRKRLRSYKLFRNLEVNMLLALVVSILTYIFAYPELGTPLFICTILRTMDSIMCVMAARLFAIYLMEYVDAGRRMKWIGIVGNIIFYVYLVLMILNLPLKFILWYAPDGTYMHGALFVPIVFSGPVYYLSSGIIMLIISMRTLGPREQVALSAASIITLLGTVIQAATDGSLLLSLPFGSAGIFVLYFSLETTDYHELIKSNEKLRIAEQDAIKANRAKSDFLASMSHEIRTPLNAVLGMDELIINETRPEKQIDPSSAVRIREYADNIKDAGQILLSVINDILDLTKIESGKMEIKAAPYKLHTLTADIDTMIRIKAEQKGLTYIQQIDQRIPDRLIGDELRIRQIMINLLNNAVKYTDFGVVRLEVSSYKISDDTINLCISVKDTGIGIRSEDIPHIFGNFQRLNEEHNHSIEGTGLGLSIVKRMVELMNGRIEVSSEYGRGSVFTVVIPQTVNSGKADESAGAGIPEETEAAAPFITPECTYLVVDDNRLNLVVATRFLDDLKGRIETASSGTEALQKMREKKYDIIFMDHMMPGMDGIQTYRTAIKDPENINTATPVIMMTANALNGVREEYLDIGFTDYLSKPVDINELKRIVKRHIPPEKAIRQQ
ncbi:MAG: response regulator [Lachnospiraceae bacterium]|nr:response regulator [Lachnospiraceae bacterium]